MFSRSLAIVITGYQRYISPYKGFCCAYRAKHGGLSCSEYVKQAVLQDGIWHALPTVKQRFKDCKVAALEFSANNTNPRRRHQNQNRQGKISDMLELCDCCNPIETCGSLFETTGGAVDICACSW